jgi:hypothetical protein
VFWDWYSGDRGGDVVSVDEWLDERESSPTQEASDAAEPLAEVFKLARALCDWECPKCGVKIRLSHRPESKLSSSARLILAMNVPIVFVLLVFAIVGRKVGIPPDIGTDILCASLVLWPLIALSLPRIVTVRCRECGFVDRQERQSPVSWKAILSNFLR